MSEHVEPALLRPLPSRPNLEFERKRAKRLVRTGSGSIALADAQRTIAREYGFNSWRKLVVYYTTAHAHNQAAPQLWSTVGGFDKAVDAILREWRERRELADQPKDFSGTAAAAATYIPRCFGLTDAEIFAAGISEGEARLIVARRSRFSSWDALTTFHDSAVPALAAAQHQTNDASIAQTLVTRPELKRAPSPDTPYDEYTWKLILEAFIADRPMARQCVVDSSVDLQPHLDYALLGRPGWGLPTSYVRGLLDLGARPESMPPNGATVLEHAIALYKNGEAANLVAEHVRPRRSFWVAAGLGDVAGMRRFLDRRGRPTTAARDHRLDMVALGSLQFYTGRPDASDAEVLSEAFLVAGLNGRRETMQALLDVGFPVDYVYIRYTMLHFSIEMAHAGVVELLLQNGADPDFKATPDSVSPREFAQLERADATKIDALDTIRRLLASR